MVPVVANRSKRMRVCLLEKTSFSLPLAGLADGISWLFGGVGSSLTVGWTWNSFFEKLLLC